MPHFLQTINGTSMKEGLDVSYYRFPELKYIPHLREELLGFKIIHECTLLKEKVYMLTENPQPKIDLKCFTVFIW